MPGGGKNRKIRCTNVTEDEDAGQENPAIPLGCPATGGAGQGVGFHGLHLHGFSSSVDLPTGANSENQTISGRKFRNSNIKS
jgi:hypothetical protein